MSSNEKEPPLKCYTSSYNRGELDHFSGWYSVSNKEKCNDFCFWNLTQQFNNVTITTANPHQTTRIEGIATWGCLLDVAGDDTTWKDAYPLFQEYGENKFDHLRCSKNAGEYIGQTLFKSVLLWVLLITISFSIFIIESIYFRRTFWKRRSGTDTYERITLNESSSRELVAPETENWNEHPTLDEITPDEEPLSKSTTSGEVDCSTYIIGAHSNRCISRMKKWWLLTIIVLFNVTILFIIFISILSILEIGSGIDFQPFALKVLTPACSASMTCPNGEVDIDNPSFPNSISSEEFQPFSYIIASDAQLDWYNGESAYLGKKTYPPPCSAGDSCGSCTSKVGHYTNSQMKYAMEKLIHADDSNPTTSGGPAPKTLVMNGDLTAYFHRHERLEYEKLFHGIKGLEEYFPGLGNHDYDQEGYATYDSDAWSQKSNCNSVHALEYFRGAFCNNVPNFDANKRITRHDSKSLAYSWEKGPYHFVQLHYFPHYENAKLGISNSLEWLERDLNLANETNLTSVIFVHSVFHLSSAVESMFLKNNVAAIFAAHLHKCFGRKCANLSPLSEWEVDQIVNQTKNAEDVKRGDKIEKCFPGVGALCSSNVNRVGQDLFSLKYVDQNFTLPDRKLYYSQPPAKKNVCPVREKNATFINTTDNTLLCRLQTFSNKESDEGNNTSNVSSSARNIPIFWSGSSSFETFILADFYHNRFVVNFNTAMEGNEGARYVDIQKVPNAVYPSHEESDLNEITIHI